MKELKLSYYNHLFEDGEKIYAYNSLSNSLALLTTQEYDQLSTFRKNGTPLDEGFTAELQKGMFLLPADFDEIQYLKDRNEKIKSRSDFVSLTIAPTLDCNFCCIYCYEKGQRNSSFMSESTERDICNYVESKKKEIRYLSVTWYGGEPLLAGGTIRRLSDYFIRFCRENKINYNAGIVTNGYCIDETTISLFKEALISHCQITLDGEEKTHDRRRIYKDGTGTFKTIIDNIIRYGSLIPNLVIRVNVDKDNTEALSGLEERFRKAGIGNIRVLPAPVRNTWNCFDEKRCFSSNEYQDFELSSIKEGNDSLAVKAIPSIKGNHCTADLKNSFVIGPDGSLYKCWCDIGVREQTVGNISSPSDITDPAGLMGFDPYSDEECSRCKLLPVCLGGCFHDRLHLNYTPCISLKGNEKAYIKYISRVLLKKGEQSL